MRECYVNNGSRSSNGGSNSNNYSNNTVAIGGDETVTRPSAGPPADLFFGRHVCQRGGCQVVNYLDEAHWLAVACGKNKSNHWPPSTMMPAHHATFPATWCDAKSTWSDAKTTWSDAKTTWSDAKTTWCDAKATWCDAKASKTSPTTTSLDDDLSFMMERYLDDGDAARHGDVTVQPSPGQQSTDSGFVSDAAQHNLSAFPDQESIL
jgi:hypothetical protein